MTRPQRRLHLVAWLGLAAALCIGLGLSLAFRESPPLTTTDPRGIHSTQFQLGERRTQMNWGTRGDLPAINTMPTQEPRP